jgi:hypothetical protein
MCVFCRKKTENSNLVSTDTAGLGDDALHVLNLSLAAGEGTELWWIMISWVLWGDTEIRAERGVLSGCIWAARSRSIRTVTSKPNTAPR